MREELLCRGHRVVAVCRDATSLPAGTEGLEVRAGDVFDPDVLARAVRDAEVVVCSVALRDPGQAGRTPAELLRLVSHAGAAAGPRLVTIGGAGSLRDPDGVDLVDRPEFPEIAKPESLGFRQALHDLRDATPTGLTWTMLSPPMSIEVDGERTGTYRTPTLLSSTTRGARVSRRPTSPSPSSTRSSAPASRGALHSRLLTSAGSVVRPLRGVGRPPQS